MADQKSVARKPPALAVGRSQDNEHAQIMAAVLRDVWTLAEGWSHDDDTQPIASDIFTAYSTLIAWETERGVPHTVPDTERKR
jgi:hypothetical protein